ncbi:hypothetical protein [Aquimarina latercula]|uniref:hypothetical protein n=1 Tax=Aquimarina latercula TaxID=987 RepID=UPI0004150CA3|nr:hypothetical protein [Aquimarina latercula]
MDLSLEAFKSLDIDPKTNEKWKQTNFYDLCCKSEFFGCAFFTTIDKSLVNNHLEALLYILQRFCDEIEGGFKFDLNWLQLHTFLHCEGYLCSYKSKAFSVPDFLKSYREIIDKMPEYENFRITKNGSIQTEFNLIEKSNILWVESIIDNWNYRQYFLETETEFIYFSWDTQV